MIMISDARFVYTEMIEQLDTWCAHRPRIGMWGGKVSFLMSTVRAEPLAANCKRYAHTAEAGLETQRQRGAGHRVT